MPSLEVFQTFLSPAIQRTELRARMLPQPSLRAIFLPFSWSRGPSLVVSILFSSPLSSSLSPSSNTAIASRVDLILWKHLQRPMQPQSPRLNHLFFCLLSSTQQHILASMPTPKQLQKPRSNSLRPVATSCLSRIWMISPSQQVETVECQISYQDYSASSHSSKRCLRGSSLPAEKEMGEPPQPRQREKSLPVPMGMMQKVRSSRLMPASAIRDTTHSTVPSPPQTTAHTRPFPFRSARPIALRTRSTPRPRCSPSKRSMKCRQITVSWPNWQVSLRLGTERYCLPLPPPLLLLMNKKKQIFSAYRSIQIYYHQISRAQPRLPPGRWSAHARTGSSACSNSPSRSCSRNGRSRPAWRT